MRNGDKRCCLSEHSAGLNLWYGEKARPLHDSPSYCESGGGSNGYRLRLWKWELQRFADQTGLSVAVCHFPPGTSKWNKVEHRLFSFISSNWRGEPLRDYETIVRSIASATTAKGLKVACRLNRRSYTAGRKITEEEMATINITTSRFHGEWNYVIRPH